MIVSGISLGAIIGLVVLFISGVTAFVTVQVTLWHHLQDCIRARASQDKTNEWVILKLDNINSNMDRLIGRMEVVQKREER
jgi:hypothetical protein